MGINGFTKVVEEAYKTYPENFIDKAKKKGIISKKRFSKSELAEMIKSELAWQIPGQPQTVDQTRKSKLNIQNDQLLLLKSDKGCSVEKKHHYPYKSIGIVHSVKKLAQGPQVIMGTGCIIGPNLVLTCAHNCYWDDRHQLLSDISFVPSVLEDQCKQHRFEGVGYKAKKVYIPDEYQDLSLKCSDADEYYRYNYAILVLEDDNLSHKFGSFGFNFEWEDDKSKYTMAGQSKLIEQANIIGYRIDDQHFELNKYKGTAIIHEDWLLYSSDLFQGMTGSPIFIEKQNDGLSIIGLHQRSIQNINIKCGLKFSKQIFQNLKENFLTERQVHYYDLSTTVTIRGQKHIDPGQEEDLIDAISDTENTKNKDKQSILSINLTYNQIGQKGCQILSKSSWSHLHTLDLTFNNIGKEGCLYLKNATKWINLRRLILAFNNIGDIGCERLSKAQWPNLELLDLTDNQIYRQGCFFLAQGKWSKLTTLILSIYQSIQFKTKLANRVNNILLICLGRQNVTNSFENKIDIVSMFKEFILLCYSIAIMIAMVFIIIQQNYMGLSVSITEQRMNIHSNQSRTKDKKGASENEKSYRIADISGGEQEAIVRKISIPAQYKGAEAVNIPEIKMEKEIYRPKEERQVPSEYHLNPENDIAGIRNSTTNKKIQDVSSRGRKNSITTNKAKNTRK